MAKKFKKLLKKAGKAALIAGALYGATKLGKRGLKGNVEKTAAMEGITKPFKHDLESYTPKKVFKHAPYDVTQDKSFQGAAKGGRIGAKHGGSVTGIAKRGFGRALMKGKK